VKITDVPAIFLHQPEMDIFTADGSQDALLIRIETDAGIIGFGTIGAHVMRRCAVAT
jgi:L-rhamnonate dehydratase